MKLVSTKNPFIVSSFEDALYKPMPDDGGLWTFETITPIPHIPPEQTLSQLAQLIFRHLDTCSTTDSREINDKDLKHICDDAFNIEIPIKQLDGATYVAELFHGNTMAFKDFGARFLARVMKHFDRKTHILVATSGDTGSAVANAFSTLSKDTVKVSILYPKGMVSDLQEAQLTTYGDNVTAYEVKAPFDRCQDHVKRAFRDEELSQNLSSANSINIGRLFGQIAYYFYIVQQIGIEDLMFVIPTGNAGNITACLIAKQLGLPIKGIISACNTNDAFSSYVRTGELISRSAISTFSNAMDITKPSNLERFKHIYKNEYVISTVTTEQSTIDTIRDVYYTHKYIVCPHTACAIDATKKNQYLNERFAVIATAHPVKFNSVIENAIGLTLKTSGILKKKRRKIPISDSYYEWKNTFGLLNGLTV